MNSLIYVIFSVFGYVIIGFIIKKFINLSEKITSKFDYLSFNILLPLALITYFWQIEFPRINTLLLLVAFFGSGIIVFIIGFLVGNLLFKYKTDDNALLGLSACFGNSVALGIPLMHSLLGKSNVMPYMILVLFHGLVHFTYTTIIIPQWWGRCERGRKCVRNVRWNVCYLVWDFGCQNGWVLFDNASDRPELLCGCGSPWRFVGSGCVQGRYSIFYCGCDNYRRLGSISSNRVVAAITDLALYDSASMRTVCWIINICWKEVAFDDYFRVSGSRS